MLLILASVLFGGTMLLAISLLRVYRYVPEKELKRRARRGDDLARLLHQAVAYGVSLDILLWGFVGLTSGLLFIILARSLPALFALLILTVLVWVGFAWLPTARVSKYSVIITKRLTPSIHWLLEISEPVLKRLTLLARRFHHVDIHTGLYEKEDIIALIDKQKVQADSRIAHEELQIVKHALSFGDKTVGEIMTPRRAIHMVSTTDNVGPLLLDTLHKSGHSRFPVFQDKETNIVGILYIRDIIDAVDGGTVRQFMRRDVFYVHEKQTLMKVLNAFLKTKHHLFMVVNDFEEIVGLVTTEDIIEQIIGKPIIDEFDQYDDLRAVAGMHAQKEHAAKDHPADDKPEQ